MKAIAPPSFRRIEFRNVTFGYDPRHPLFASVSFTIEPGEKVALAGAEGVGKSTLVELIKLLQVPTSGEILIDGIDNRTIDKKLLRRGIGIVTAKEPLFSMSVLENITLGDSAPDLNRVLDAAERAEAADFIEALPETYQTILLRNEPALSPGQCSRINLARALYQNASILILDEATSDLEEVTEAKILANLKQHAADRTMLFISRRPSALSLCDRTLWLGKKSVSPLAGSLTYTPPRN